MALAARATRGSQAAGEEDGEPGPPTYQIVLN